jgi:hypothetical protein
VHDVCGGIGAAVVKQDDIVAVSGRMTHKRLEDVRFIPEKTDAYDAHGPACIKPVPLAQAEGAMIRREGLILHD